MESSPSQHRVVLHSVSFAKDARLTAVPREQRHETFLEVYASGEDGDRLVTSIELLSIANKATGVNNRDQYIQKEREMLDSGVN